MKIVKTGDISRIFSDDLKTYDSIPVGNYKVCFHPMMGFYLEDADDFNMAEKPYGKHPLKIEKVIKLYENIERSAGVILSGKKGMGKSMFARLLSSAFAERGLPTIIVADAYPGVTDFIESIKQEVVVLFDEFEKTFDSGEGYRHGGEGKPNNKESQEKMLGLFDGISQTKRLYVVTCNEVRKMNQYLLNRPGRFHYHIQFNYPSLEEIELYLKDKLKPEFQHQIGLVKRFSNRFDLNYDSLRAIAFDLNLGYGFLETMEDLNVSSNENESVRYNVTVYHSNGLTTTTDCNVNLMSNDCSFGYYTTAGDYGNVSFSPLQVEIDNKNSFVVDAERVALRVSYSDDNEVLTDEDTVQVTRLVFTKRDYGVGKYGKEMEALMV